MHAKRKAMAMRRGKSYVGKVAVMTGDHLFARIQRNGDVVMLEPQESRGSFTARERTMRRCGANVNKETNGTL